jgi:hypothetical protein
MQLQSNPGARDSAVSSSWLPLDLAPVVAGVQAGEIVGPVPTMMLRADLVPLLYPGEVHSLSGEPESCKGWLALYAAVSMIEIGGAVLYVDFEDGAPAIIGRLLALGALPEAIIERFTYVRPDDPFNAEAFHELLGSRTFALVVVDGLTEGYGLLGLDINSNDDAAKFLAAIPRPAAAAGAAVLEIDHVGRNKDARGRYSIGAQHKLAGVAVAYGTDVIKTLSRTTPGLIKLKVDKDRHGHVRGRALGGVIAMAHFTPADDGQQMSVRLDPPEDTATSGEFRPTVLMARVAEFVNDEPGASRNHIRQGVAGRGEWVDKALHLLTAEGYIDRRKEGQTYAHYTLLHYENQPGPTESQPSPGNSPANRVPGSPPLRDPVPDPVGSGPAKNSNRVPDPVGSENGNRVPLLTEDQLQALRDQESISP